MKGLYLEAQKEGGGKGKLDVSVDALLNSHKILLDLRAGLCPNRFQRSSAVTLLGRRKTTTQLQAMST